MRVGWDLAAQQRAADVLRGAVARQEVAHAWAFVGPAGVGQERLTRTLAAALNCPVATPADAPCGQCDTCLRCARGTHPAYLEFVPTGAQHRVSDVREQWLFTASRTSLEGAYKILRIIDADRLNEPAANAFLKGLEEPPQGTIWVLDIADPAELPDTIMSRCRVVRFAAWGREELDAEAVRLGLESPRDRGLAVRASLGSPVTLARLAAPGGLEDLRAHRAIPGRLRADGPGHALLAARALDDETKRATAALKQANAEEQATLAGFYGDAVPRSVARQVEQRANRRAREARTAVVSAVLDDLLGWYRDCLLVATGGDVAAAIHADVAAELREDADAYGPRSLLIAADRVLATRDSLEFNVGLGLAVEALLLELSTLTMG